MEVSAIAGRRPIAQVQELMLWLSFNVLVAFVLLCV